MCNATKHCPRSMSGWGRWPKQHNLSESRHLYLKREPSGQYQIVRPTNCTNSIEKPKTVSQENMALNYDSGSKAHKTLSRRKMRQFRQKFQIICFPLSFFRRGRHHLIVFPLSSVSVCRRCEVSFLRHLTHVPHIIGCGELTSSSMLCWWQGNFTLTRSSSPKPLPDSNH